MLSLPSFVLGLVFRSPRAWPLLVVFSLCWCFCLRVCGCLSEAVVRLSVGGWVSFCLSCVWLLSAPLPCRLLLPSPAVCPLWRPGPVSTLVPPSGYLVAFCEGLVALPYCWGCGCALSSSLHFVSWQQRPLALCGVCPLHHDAYVVRVLSITMLRYSSMMIQVPHWTPLSYTFAIFGSKCGILRSCPLLPSRCPSLVPVVVVSWFVALLVPSVSSCNLPCPHLGA